VGYRTVFALAGAFTLATCASLGCGGDNGTEPTAIVDAGDAGDAEARVVDAPPPEASMQWDGSAGDDGGSVGPNCGTVPPSGRHIVSSMNVAIDGVTSDGYAIYTNTTTNMVFAAAIAGDAGAPAQLGRVFASNPVIAISGRVVYYASPSEAGAAAGDLSVWTAATGSNLLSTGAYVPATGPWFASVSPDGSHIVYLDGATPTGATLTVATTDGNIKKPLIANVDLTRSACRPAAVFAGTSVVAAYCVLPSSDAGAAGGDASTDASLGGNADAGTRDAAPADGAWAPGEGGSPPNFDVATIAAFTGSNFDPVPIATNVDSYFDVDQAGGQLLISSAGGLFVYPSAGGAVTPIDATGAAGTFTKDGKDVIYTTNASALRRLRVASPPPITLVANGLSEILAVSPDENWILARNSKMNLSFDLYLASATTAGGATPLSAMPTADLFGDPFTADSRYVLFFTNAANGNTGDFYVAPTMGGTPTKVTSNAWREYATAGTRGVVNDNYNTNGGSSGNGIADIESFDATNPAGLKTLVTAADANFYASPRKDEIVYSWSCAQSSNAGIWVLSSP
jgi:hypothetical protein